MRLRNLDLNLLVVFGTVLTERSVVRAADMLAMTQPAVSQALNRLRHALKDGLFVRTPSGIIPTRERSSSRCRSFGSRSC
ncbi:LysR family transcriptional regulator [Bradyrhizobium sp. RDM4]|uniref:LysR family transcriptional regulator n=1 Tax=Bradyrhizobium sp. RDM4 TaxID=3378765 RepID=UPI0038FCA7D2